MRTIETRGPEEPPQPGEVIDAFEASNNALVESALRLHVSPSATSKEDFIRYAARAVHSITPFSTYGFFRDSDTQIPLAASVDKITDASKQLVDTTLDINPLWPPAERYAEIDREQTIEVLGGEDDAAAKKARDLCRNYSILVANMQEGVLRSPNVALFIEKQASRAELQERLLALSVVAAGTFLGTFFAQRRKK